MLESIDGIAIFIDARTPEKQWRYRDRSIRRSGIRADAGA
jgi:hypothetical protein